LQGTVDKLECASDNLGLENCKLKEQIKDLKIELRAVKRQKTGLQKERDNLVMERRRMGGEPSW
jgi:dynactin complex subunit